MKRHEYNKTKMITHKNNKMKILQVIILSVLLSAVGCSFSTKKNKVENEPINDDALNIYAENSKGGYLLIQTDKNGKAYFKMRGANYLNHYFGKLNKKEGIITFIPDEALRINNCKSGKYGQSVIGFEFGKDEKALDKLKKFNVTYETESNQTKILKIDSLRTYIEIPEQESVTIKLESSNKSFFKPEKITLNPSTTMVCVSSRIRLNDYKFEIKEDKVIVINYFGTPQTYTLKESPF